MSNDIYTKYHKDMENLKANINHMQIALITKYNNENAQKIGDTIYYILSATAQQKGKDKSEKYIDAITNLYKDIVDFYDKSKVLTPPLKEKE